MCKHWGDGLSMMPELTPSYDRMVIKDPAGLEAIFLDQLMKQDSPNNKSLKVGELQSQPDVVHGTFQLSRANLQKLRQLITTMLEEKNEQKQPVHLSSFSLTCAYAWVCMAKAEGPRDNQFLLGISADARHRLEPPIPGTYFGNCVGGFVAVAERNGLVGEEGMIVAIMAVSEAVRGLDDGIFRGIENPLQMLFRAQTDRVVGIAGSPRFEVYNTDFGWGRPRKVEMVSIDNTGPICLSECRDSVGGVEVGLALKKHEMEVFASLFSKGLEAL